MKADIICTAFRGFCQSEGRPNDKWVLRDSLAIFNYANQLRADYNKTFLWCKSLGCAIGIKALCEYTER